MSQVHINTELVDGSAKHVAAAQNGVGNTWKTLAGALDLAKGMGGNPGTGIRRPPSSWPPTPPPCRPSGGALPPCTG